jgi:hypothetical protein
MVSMDFEEKKLKFLQKGQIDRVKYFEELNKKLLPSIVHRIQQNDKTVLKEIVKPEWLDWETLFEWSQLGLVVHSQ